MQYILHLMQSHTAATAPLVHDWYDSALGVFVLPRERRLVQKMLAPWPRRGRSLLEVGCGSGRFLDVFWDAGFDVTALDPDPVQLEAANVRLGGRVETRLGVPDALPFEDDAFDFVSLGPFSLCQNTQRGTQNVADALREAARVAALGVLLRFWNPHSLAAVGKTLRGQLPGECLNLSWGRARSILRDCVPHCTLSTRSLLHGPVSLWREGVLSRVCDTIVPLPLGALLAVRLTCVPSTPLTGLPLRIRPLCLDTAQPAAAMERRAQRLGRQE